MQQDCPFCELEESGTSTAFRKLFASMSFPEIILSTDRLHVILCAPPIVEGHCLIVTKGHRLNTLGDELKEEMREAKTSLADLFKNFNCLPVFFEHGGTVPAQHSCVEHAHVHAIPARSPVFPDSDWEGLQWQRDGQPTLRPGSDFCMLTDTDQQTYWAEGERMPSQLIRRVFAARYGLEHRDAQDFLQMPNHLGTRALIENSARRLNLLTIQERRALDAAAASQ